MKIFWVILFTYLAVVTAQEQRSDSSNEKPISSSYTYSIEYNDDINGKYGHKIEVKDGSAKVNVNALNKKNSIPDSKPQKAYLPEKRHPAHSKPKTEISYAPQQDIKTNQQFYSAPMQDGQHRPAATASPINTYTQQQLAVLLAQNKNPFLPVKNKEGTSLQSPSYQTQPKVEYQYVPQSQSTYDYSQSQPANYAQSQSVASASPEDKNLYKSVQYSSPVVYKQPEVYPMQSYQSSGQSYPSYYSGQSTGAPTATQYVSMPKYQQETASVYVPQQTKVQSVASEAYSVTHGYSVPQVKYTVPSTVQGGAAHPVQYTIPSMVQNGAAHQVQYLSAAQNEAHQFQYTSPNTVQSGAAHQVQYTPSAVQSGAAHQVQYTPSTVQSEAAHQIQYTSPSMVHGGAAQYYYVPQSSVSYPQQPSGTPHYTSVQYPSANQQTGPIQFGKQNTQPGQTFESVKGYYSSPAHPAYASTGNNYNQAANQVYSYSGQSLGGIGATSNFQYGSGVTENSYASSPAYKPTDGGQGMKVVEYGTGLNGGLPAEYQGYSSNIYQGYGGHQQFGTQNVGTQKSSHQFSNVDIGKNSQFSLEYKNALDKALKVATGKGVDVGSVQGVPTQQGSYKSAAETSAPVASNDNVRYVYVPAHEYYASMNIDGMKQR